MTRTTAGDGDESSHSEWGCYCPHGRKIVEAVPAEHTCTPRQPVPLAEDPFGEVPEATWCKGCHPDGCTVEPWPCTEPNCTREGFDKAMDAEVEEYGDSVSQLLADQYN